MKYQMTYNLFNKILYQFVAIISLCLLLNFLPFWCHNLIKL